MFFAYDAYASKKRSCHLVNGSVRVEIDGVFGAGEEGENTANPHTLIPPIFSAFSSPTSSLPAAPRSFNAVIGILTPCTHPHAITTARSCSGVEIHGGPPPKVPWEPPIQRSIYRG